MKRGARRTGQKGTATLVHVASLIDGAVSTTEGDEEEGARGERIHRKPENIIFFCCSAFITKPCALT